MYCPPLNWRLMLENRGKHMSLTLTGRHLHTVGSEEVQQHQAAFMCWRHPVSLRLGVCERVQLSFRLVSHPFGCSAEIFALQRRGPDKAIWLSRCINLDTCRLH